MKDHDISCDVIPSARNTVVVLREGLSVRPVAFERCQRLLTKSHLGEKLRQLPQAPDFKAWAERCGCGTVPECRVCYLQIEAVALILKSWLQEDYNSYIAALE